MGICNIFYPTKTNKQGTYFDISKILFTIKKKLKINPMISYKEIQTENTYRLFATRVSQLKFVIFRRTF
jgi:hypothetical protein